MLSVTADVVLRFAFGRGLVWSFEVTEFLLLYIPMLTLPWLARQRAHIQIDVVISRLPHAAAARLDILACALVAAICIFIAYWSTIATLDAYERGIENAGLVAWPRWALLVSIPPAFALTAFEYLRIAGIRLREVRKDGVE
jgi:C4-dicarboxylate transporter DctQ subunit